MTQHFPLLPLIDMVISILSWSFLLSVVGGTIVLLQNPILRYIQRTSRAYTPPKNKDAERSHAQQSDSSSEEEEIVSSPKKEESPERTNTHSAETIPLLRKAEMLIARQEYDDAKKVLIQVLTWDEKNVEAESHLGYAYLKTQEHSKAEALFRRVLESRPRDASILTNFALCLFEQKKPDGISESIDALRKAVEIDSGNACRHSNLGQSLFFSGEVESAVDAFRSAVRLDKKNIEHHFFLADSLLSLQNFSEAKKVFLRILEISPLNEEAKQELRALEQRGV